MVMYDRATGKPRGFGFITYKDEMSIDLVLQDKLQHKIRNKWIECKRATPKIPGQDNTINNFETPITSSYSYTPEMVPAEIIEPLIRKLSVENIPFTKITEQQSISGSQTTCPNTTPDNADENSPDGYRQMNQSYSSYEGNIHAKFFTNLDPANDQRSILEKAESLNWEEDGVTTYSEIFED